MDPPVADGWQYQPPEFPIWRYQKVVYPGAGTLKRISGDLEKPIYTPGVRVHGYIWEGSFLGPTLVAEQDHEIEFEVRNDTPEPIELVFEGVEIVDVFPVRPGDNDQLQRIRTTLGPGVSIYRGRSADGRLAGEGMLGLVTVRDACEIDPRLITQQANLIVFDTWTDSTQVNHCSPKDHVAGDLDDGLPDAPGCPDWRPAGEPTTALVAQLLVVADGWDLSQAPPSYADCDGEGSARRWQPGSRERDEPAWGEPRHGGDQNEFRTITTASPTLSLWTGETTRLNFANASDIPHTLHLGGLLWRDPLSGERRGAIYLEPGQGGYALLPELDQVGMYVARCIDHDHGGTGEVLLVVDDRADPSRATRLRASRP